MSNFQTTLLASVMSGLIVAGICYVMKRPSESPQAYWF